MNKFKVIYSLLGGIIVVLCAVLFFIFGSNNANQQSKVKNKPASSSLTKQHQEQHSSIKSSSSSSKPQKAALNNEELAVAAYINSVRGDSIDDKFKTFDELATGQSSNPATEQPIAIEQHEDPTFQIDEGQFGFAWYIISFNNDQINVDHYTHGDKDFSKSYTKNELADQFGNYKPQLDLAIQKIQQNQAQNNVKMDDSEN
ncbi:hypothetical protein FC35_GL001837 [Limosilactobacillus coleohominis DSM 14060]|nr:hypothetical protein FC35_GL001837 [Limosilactobacillus coleohominis DSM 14060]